MIGTNKLPTKGDEQVIDIELDKDTVLKPAKTGYPPVKARSHWENMSNIKSSTNIKHKLDDPAPLNAVEPNIPGKLSDLSDYHSSQIFPSRLISRLAVIAVKSVSHDSQR